MSEPDWADLRAQEWLPCSQEMCWSRQNGQYHVTNCPARQRPVMAAALRSERELNMSETTYKIEINRDQLIREYDELLDACVELRSVLDIDFNPGMIGSPVEVVLQAKADILKLKDQVENLEYEIVEAYE